MTGARTAGQQETGLGSPLRVRCPLPLRSKAWQVAGAREGLGLILSEAP